MNKIYKLSILEGHYLKGTKCGCGKPKRRKRWCCRACKRKHWDSKEAAALRDACDNHVRMGRAFIKRCRQFSPR